MTLIKRNDQYLPNIWEDFFDSDFFNSKKLATSNPAVNISDRNDHIAVELAAPGLKKDDFHVNLEHNVLTISAEKKKEDEHKEERYTRREFNYTSFQRSFTLPDNVEPEKIKAKYDDGVLSVSIPKKEEAKQPAQRQIEIN